MTVLFAVLLALAFVIAGFLLRSRYVSFWAQGPGDYAAHGPAFDIRQAFNGPLLCEGVVFGITGRVTSRFVADFEASWQGNVGVMREVFTYDTGSVQRREWRLAVDDAGRIRAEADDVVGTGTGHQSGSAVRLSYKLRLAPETGGHVLDTTDWMYLTPNGTIMNRSQFRKFGLPVAELVATMRRKVA
jgi:hypothetical protein